MGVPDSDIEQGVGAWAAMSGNSFKREVNWTDPAAAIDAVIEKEQQDSPEQEDEAPPTIPTEQKNTNPSPTSSNPTSSLDDVFGDDPPPPSPSPTSSLDDVFTDTPTPDTSGLADVFDDTDLPSTPETSKPTHPSQTTTGSLDDVFTQDTTTPPTSSLSPGDLADVFADEPTPTQPPSPVSNLDDVFDTTDSSTTPPPFTSQTPDSATPPTDAGPSVSQKKSKNHRAKQERAVVELCKRYLDIGDLWLTVNQVLSLFATDPELIKVVQRLELTRDEELDRSQREDLQNHLSSRLYNRNINLPSPEEMEIVIDLVYDELVGLSVLGPFWRDDHISEILVDDWDQIVVERGGILVDTPLSFRDLSHVLAVARNLAAKISDRQLAPKTPLVSAVLPSARVAFAVAPVAKTGISISLRKLMPLLDMDKLLEMGALSPQMRDFLSDAIASAANVVVSGGTSTGKTTIINALSEFIPTTERVITIEDVFELRLTAPDKSQRRKWVAMQTKEAASGDDTIRIDTADLLKNSLRMRPDRILVGEVRDAPAASVLMQAANTGHEGTMCTVHASDPERALNFRLANWVRTGTAATSMTNDVACAEVAHAFDLLIQVERESSKRFISSISVVDPSLVEGDFVTAQPLFSGQLKDNVPVFSQVSSLRTDTDLAQKLKASNRLSHWIDQ